MTARQDILGIYRTLYRAYGPQGWWPGDSPLEVIVGAILTQNTAWTNVEKAIRNLKSLGLLSRRGLKDVSRAQLARAIRPSGYYNIKSKRLKNFVGFLFGKYGGSLRKMGALKDTRALRDELLAVNGIGRETADSILLYAFQRPAFVVDAYTKRVFSRHGFVRHDADYGEVQSLFTSNLPADAKLFNEFHALIVRIGKDVCRSKPKCEVCPMKYYKRPKYKLDTKKVQPKEEKELEGEDIFREILRDKKRKAR